MIPTLVVAIVAAVAFLAWRYVSSVRGGRRRTRALAERVGPVLREVRAGSEPREAIAHLAVDPATRNLLRAGLEALNAAHLFPAEFATPEAAAASDLVVWLRHPKALGSSPEELTLAATVVRPGAEPGETWYYFVFRFRTLAKAAGGWLAGVAGPYRAGGRRAGDHGPDGTFSQFKPWDGMTPEGHVAFSHAMALRYRGLVTASTGPAPSSPSAPPASPSAS